MLMWNEWCFLVVVFFVGIKVHLPVSVSRTNHLHLTPAEKGGEGKTAHNRIRHQLERPNQYSGIRLYALWLITNRTTHKNAITEDNRITPYHRQWLWLSEAKSSIFIRVKVIANHFSREFLPNAPLFVCVEPIKLKKLSAIFWMNTWINGVHI